MLGAMLGVRRPSRRGHHGIETVCRCWGSSRVADEMRGGGCDMVVQARRVAGGDAIHLLRGSKWGAGRRMGK